MTPNISDKQNSPFRLALLGDSTTQFLNKFLVESGVENGITLNILEAGFNQIQTELLDSKSELYDFQAQLILIGFTAKKITSSFYKTTQDQRGSFYQEFLGNIQNLISSIHQYSSSKILLFNLEELDDNIFGNYSNKYRSSLLNQIKRINTGLMDIAENQNLFILDINKLAFRFGKEFCYAPNIYISTDLVHSLDFTKIIAGSIVQFIKALKGQIVKCIVLDLDNTLWGGIIGDDGIEKIEIGNIGIGKAFLEFQYFLKELKNRGILLAVCSKNTESVAKLPFLNHPDMILKLEDFAVFIANWENKADNIQIIRDILEIGFDSMVFLDDNPMERELVRSKIPGINVPELPEDPAYYTDYIQSLNLFETLNIGGNDQIRTKQYQEEAQRRVLSTQFAKVEDFLTDLKMVSDVRPFNTFDTPRIAQLSQRSNQFNLTTIRYTESDIASMIEDSKHVTFSFNLKDKLGDHGLICVIILEKQEKDLWIKSWMMSCRVLKRTMENFCLNTLMNYAIENNYSRLIGQYIPTEKNELVKDHYKNLCFVYKDGYWHLELIHAKPLLSFITLKEKSL